jgi:hypothetical protein
MELEHHHSGYILTFLAFGFIACSAAAKSMWIQLESIIDRLGKPGTE